MYRSLVVYKSLLKLFYKNIFKCFSLKLMSKVQQELCQGCKNYSTSRDSKPIQVELYKGQSYNKKQLRVESSLNLYRVNLS